MTDPQTRCGFLAVIGLPNAGKSTLINTLVGSKVSIVSAKAQTTRTRVLGILTYEQTQIILIDTPGIFDAQKTLERAMVTVAFDALEESDSILHIVDASQKSAVARNTELVKKLPRNKPVVLILNKVDQVNKPDLLDFSSAMNSVFPYQATFMISALKNKGTEGLLNHTARMLPEGPWMFDPEEMTDMPMRMMAAEMTREKICNQLHHELPHATLVLTESWEPFENGSIKIDQVIIVQRESQKAIVVGKGGNRIKQIGQEARQDMEALFDLRIHLKLFVKVDPQWNEKPENLKLLGLIR